MDSREGKNTPGQGIKALLVVAALVVIAAGFRAAAPLLLPLLLALFLTALSLPLLNWLVRRRVRMPLALLVTVLAVFGVLLGLGFLISGTVNEFAKAAPSYLERLVEQTKTAIEALEGRDVPVSDWFTIEPIDPKSLVDVAGGILGGTVKGVASAVSFITLVTLTMIFMLAEAAGFPAKLGAALGGGRLALSSYGKIALEIQRYLALKTVVSAATGILLGLWVALLGVPFALLWGLLAFVLNYVPAIGSILAAIPAVLLTLLQFGLGRGLLVGLGYLAVNMLLGNLLEPRLMGRRFGLSTLVVFLSLMFWGWLWGPLGMLLSVPLTVTLKIAFENTPSMRWVGVLLGPASAGAAAPAAVAGEEGKVLPPPDGDARAEPRAEEEGAARLARGG